MTGAECCMEEEAETCPAGNHLYLKPKTFIVRPAGKSHPCEFFKIPVKGLWFPYIVFPGNLYGTGQSELVSFAKGLRHAVYVSMPAMNVMNLLAYVLIQFNEG